MRWGIVVAVFPPGESGENGAEVGVLMTNGDSAWFDCVMMGVEEVNGMVYDDRVGGWVTRGAGLDGLRHMMPAEVVDRLHGATSEWSEPVS
jgi:hypothetical protein